MYGTGERFSYGECAACASLTLLDPPEDFAPYYPRDYLSMTADPAALSAAQRIAIGVVARSLIRGDGHVARGASRVLPVRQMRTLVTILESVARVPGPAPSKVLDVGTGSGMVPFAISRAGGIDVLGIDPFAASSRRLGPRVEVQALGLRDVAGSFDLVMLHHSLEHMLDPLSSLRDAAARLDAEGVILVRVPTASSFAWREYRTDWVQLDPPRHVWIPSREGIALLAARAGLEVVSGYDDANEFQFWGSEQARRGIALTAPSSHFVSPRAAVFTRAQMRAYQRRSVELNRAGAGDQTVVYLRAVA
jgi:SAM-dependent methyltransferase